MVLSQLAKNIRRFHRLQAIVKRCEKEIDALKSDFRERAGDEDVVFEYRDMEVPVTWKERQSWDGQRLATHFGDKADGFKKTSRYAEVGCRKKAE